MKIKRSAKLLGFGCVGVPILVALLGYCGICLMFNNLPFHTNPFDTLAFNQQDWLEDASCVDGGNRRGHMADDIVRHHLRLGMLAPSITSLLGTPETIYSHAEVAKYVTSGPRDSSKMYVPRDLQASKVYSYYLGEELGMGGGVDRAWLYLYLDKQKRYCGYRIATP